MWISTIIIAVLVALSSYWTNPSSCEGAMHGFTFPLFSPTPAYGNHHSGAEGHMHLVSCTNYNLFTVASLAEPRAKLVSIVFRSAPSTPIHRSLGIFGIWITIPDVLSNGIIYVYDTLAQGIFHSCSGHGIPVRQGSCLCFPSYQSSHSYHFLWGDRRIGRLLHSSCTRPVRGFVPLTKTLGMPASVPILSTSILADVYFHVYQATKSISILEAFVLLNMIIWMAWLAFDRVDWLHDHFTVPMAGLDRALMCPHALLLRHFSHTSALTLLFNLYGWWRFAPSLYALMGQGAFMRYCLTACLVTSITSAWWAGNVVGVWGRDEHGEGARRNPRRAMGCQGLIVALRTLWLLHSLSLRRRMLNPFTGGTILDDFWSAPHSELIRECVVYFVLEHAFLPDASLLGDALGGILAALIWSGFSA